MLVLDLSKPEELWLTMDRLMTYIRNRVDTVIAEGRSDDPYLKEDLTKKMKQRIGDCPDKDMIDPLLVPLVIVGAKFDMFQVATARQSTANNFLLHCNVSVICC